MSWKWWLFLIILFLVTQGFFAMLEMACICFNKVRLQYWVSQNQRRAKWLSDLLSRPALLFGVVLIGINASLQLGSECARRFYESLGVSPDWAPLSQIFLVIIFAELTPLFAGMRYAEHVAMMGIPILYAFSIIFRPIIWFLDLICQLINRLLKSPVKEGLYLSREELQLLFEQREEEGRAPKEMNKIVSSLFSLKNKTPKELMIPLKDVQMIPAFCTVGEMRALLAMRYTPYLPIYQRQPDHITGIVYPRDLLRLSEDKKVREHARPGWFITENSSILHILKQFRSNNQSLAIVLGETGVAIGILTLDEIVDEIFGKSDDWEAFGDISPRMHHVIVDRTFPGDMLITDFNTRFHIHLEAEGAETLEELMEKHLGHVPERGERVQVDQFELLLEEAPLIGPKKIAIRTVF